MSLRKLCPALAVAALASTSSAAVIFDFEGLLATGMTGFYTSLNYVKDDISLDIARTSGVGFDVQFYANLFPATWGTKALSPFAFGSVPDAFVINISAAAPVNFIAAEYGDYGADWGDVHFQVWSGPGGTGDLLSHQTQYWDYNLDHFPPGRFEFAGLGIGSIKFWGEDSFAPNSLFWDNVEVGLVPAPAAGFASMLGLLGLAGPLRRRRPSPPSR